MARIFTTGGEEADPLALWNYIYPGNVKSWWVGNVFGRDQFAFAPRTGRGMYILGNWNGARPYLRNTFPATTTTELYFGLAARLNEFNNSFEIFRSYSDTLSNYNNFSGIRIKTDGSVMAVKNGNNLVTTAAGVCTIDTWHYYEVWFKPRNSSGRFAIKVDGTTVIDYTGDTTDNTEYINAYEIIGNVSSTAYGHAFDDFVVNDTTGSDNNTWPGMVRLMPFRPASAGSNADWTRAGVDLGSDAAQARNGTFEFSMLQTTTADQKVTLSTEIPDLPAGAVITNVIISARARVQSGSGVIAPMLNSNGTENISADQTLLPSWRYFQNAWHHNPEDSADWEETDLDTIDIGVSS